MNKIHVTREAAEHIADKAGHTPDCPFGIGAVANHAIEQIKGDWSYALGYIGENGEHDVHVVHRQGKGGTSKAYREGWDRIFGESSEN